MERWLPASAWAIEPLYDSAMSGSHVAEATNRYAYVIGNPIRYIDPSGLFCCGPDVTAWFTVEVAIFRGAASATAQRAEEATLNSYGPAPIGIIYLASLRQLALHMDYKLRTFNSPGCKNPGLNTVTLCGVCVKTNQLGNIMYGIVAADLNEVSAAREYGRGNTTWFQRLLGATGPKPLWTAPGQQYRENAFNVGVRFGRAGGGCGLLTAVPGAPVSTGTSHCSPCSAAFIGPNTDFTVAPLVDASGNIPE